MVWKDIVPWAFSLGMFVIALVTLAKNGKKELKQEYSEEAAKIHEIEQSLTKISTKLDALQEMMQETRTDIKAMNTGLQEMDKRLSKVENDQKTMWMRIDELKEKVGYYHEQGH